MTDAIQPPPNYGNTATREGASAPDAALRWDCGHLTTEHPRAEAARCRDAQFVHSSAHDTRLDGGRAALVAQLDEMVEKTTPSSLSMTVALWNGYLKGISTSRGPSLFLFERDVRALLELHTFAWTWNEKNAR